MLQVAVFTLLLLAAGCCLLIGGIRPPIQEFSVLPFFAFPEILTRLLLPAGCCFLIGGYKYPTQKFSATVNKASCSLLFLACIAIVIPTAAPALYSTTVLDDTAVYNISHSTAIILVLV